VKANGQFYERSVVTLGKYHWLAAE